jgi:hypothetical protein
MTENYRKSVIEKKYVYNYIYYTLSISLYEAPVSKLSSQGNEKRYCVKNQFVRE